MTRDCQTVDVGMVTQDIKIAERWRTLASSFSSHKRSQAHVLGHCRGLQFQMQQLHAAMQIQFGRFDVSDTTCLPNG